MLLIPTVRAPGARLATRDDLGEAWRRATATLPGATLAHEPEWFDVIPQTYRHEPLYLMGADENGNAGILPAFIVRRPFIGTVVTSMPFLDTGGPLAASPTLRRVLVDALLARARAVGARVVELRGIDRLNLPCPVREDKVNLTLCLPPDADAMWRGLDKGVRNQIRKAEKSGLTAEIGGAELLPAFYGVFAARMRDLGSPVHGRPFFEATVTAFKERARLVIVRKGRTPVGGLVALRFGRTLAVPWAACHQEYFSLCPNMLLYWETIRSAIADGLARFEFGRSTRGSGTYRFKRQWGAEDHPLFWHSLPVGAAHHQPGSGLHPSRAFLTGSWRRLPLSVTRQLGPVIRRYLTQ
jgi:FemAB-related protein (PEP-CTERM system-associated)